MNLHVSVTPDHIRHGKRSEECACPIALALLAAGAAWVEVLRVEARIVLSGKRWEADLPDVAVRFVRAFDRGESVDGFECELEFTVAM